MEHQKIFHLLNDTKWNIVNDNSNSNCAGPNEITYNTEILKSNLCDYNAAYILVTGNITAVVSPATQVAVKTCAPFTNCVTKIDGTTIDYDEDLDIVMPMYNLMEYSSSYSETAGSLWFYSKDETTNFNADIANDNKFESLKYKVKLLWNTVAQAGNPANGILKNATIVVLLKYLSKFWKSLEMSSIDCKAELKLK